MHLGEKFSKGNPTFSFEFFPPKSAQASEELFQTILELESFQPDFVSVTYGAGGSTREMTHDLVVRIKQETKLEPVPHLTCVCHRVDEVDAILERYTAAGVGNILALGGDPPKNLPSFDRKQDAFQHATDLVAHLKSYNLSGNHPHPQGFGIGAACFPEGHPATPNRVKEMDYLKAKVDAGVTWLCTQLFFDNHDFFDFRERCQLAGIHVPIIAGIMPVTSLNGLDRMAELAAGSRYPAKLLRALQRAKGDPEAVRRIGIHYATEQCRDLLDHQVDGIHFYTLNKSDATKEIYANLGLNVASAG